MSCGYQGYEFGAHYLDSICCDGYLWDADSGDGNYLDNGGDIPCPKCNKKAWLDYYRDEIIDCGRESGYEKKKFKVVKYGGYPQEIRSDISAMDKCSRWFRRGYYQGLAERSKDIKNNEYTPL